VQDRQRATSAYASKTGLRQLLLDAVQESQYPQYGYGLVQATALAARLGVGALSAIELGVAGGNGLVALEQLCRRHSGPSGVDLNAFGFDLGEGLPAPRDHRDAPYIWQDGFYRMDEAKLRARLDGAQLILGAVRETGPAFLSSAPPPIGLISFDLDYYSSTCDAFDGLLFGDADRYLPRVVCYFDDTVGPHWEMHSRFTGELLAIDEFNDRSANRKIGKLNGLRYKLLPYEGSWVEGIYVLHLFDHPRYNEYIFPAADRQLELDSRT
jgi:hypothetical protein